MDETLVSFEVAKLAKEKGFPQDSNSCYRSDGRLTVYSSEAHKIYKNKGENNPFKDFECVTVTQSQLLKWLREIHKIFVAVLPFQQIDDDVQLYWYYSIVDYRVAYNEDILFNVNDLGVSIDNFDTYEQAFDEGMFEAFKLISSLVSFETATLAKEIGFDIPCWDYFNYEGNEERWKDKSRINLTTVADVARPTQEVLKTWLQEKHNISIRIDNQTYLGSNRIICYYVLVNEEYVLNKNTIDDIQDFKTYEEGLEEGIRVGLLSIKNGK